MKIGGWRNRGVFDRYAIASRSDMNDAILKLQESETQAEQERAIADAQQKKTGFEAESRSLSRAVN